MSDKFVMGHENIGIIVEKGANIKEFQIGDRVVADILLPCQTRNIPECKAHNEGKTNQCSNFSKGGILTGMMLGTCKETGEVGGSIILPTSPSYLKCLTN